MAARARTQYGSPLQDEGRAIFDVRSHKGVGDSDNRAILCVCRLKAANADPSELTQIQNGL